MERRNFLKVAVGTGVGVLGAGIGAFQYFVDKQGNDRDGSDKSSKEPHEVPDFGIDIICKSNRMAVNSAMAEIGDAKVWDYILGPESLVPGRHYPGQFVLSDIDDGSKGTVDLLNCFAVVVMGVCKETHKLISGVAHQNVDLFLTCGDDEESFQKNVLIPNLRQAGLPVTPEILARMKNPKPLHAKALNQWLGEFVNRTLPDSRKSVIGDGVLYTKVPEKVDEYSRSIRYLADIIVNSGVNPEILVPKLDVFQPNGGSDSYYESVATDIFADTGENHVYVFRQPIENKSVKDGTFRVDELDDCLKSWSS